MKTDSIPPSPPKTKKRSRLRLVLLLLTLLVLIAIYRPMHRLQSENLLRRSLLNSEVAGVREALDRDADPDLTLDPSQIDRHIGSLAEFAQVFLNRSAPPDPNAKTALMFAANGSHPDIVEMLLKHGAHVNQQQAGGYSALLYAASKASPGVVESLLTHGADVKAQNREGITPLLSAVQAGQVPNVRLLMNRGADIHAADKNGRTALSIAIENPLGSLHTEVVSEEMVALLLARGANESDLKPEHLAPGTPLFASASKVIPAAASPGGGSTAPSSVVSRVQSANPSKTGRPLAPILYAAQHGNRTLLQFLWEHADPTVRQQLGTEALGKAVSSRQMAAVQFLLDQHVPINPLPMPLLPHGAAPADSNAGYTPLHYAAYDSNGLPMMQFLLAHGANVNATSADGTTPLLLAANSASLPMVQLLLAHGADVHAVDSGSGRNALMRSVSRTELVRLFLDHGVDVNARDNQGNTALMYCFNTLDASILLAHGANVNLQDHEGNTALMHIIQVQSSPKLVTLLLQHGAQVNARNNVGATALMQCVDAQNATLLLAQGAQINLQDAQGDTALAYAIRALKKGYGTDCISLLLKHGAKINVPNQRGETPLSLAKSAPDAAKLVPLLTAAPAKH